MESSAGVGTAARQLSDGCVDVVMQDSFGDGWDGQELSVMTGSGAVLFSDSVPCDVSQGFCPAGYIYSGACPSEGHSSCTLTLCLDDGCYDVSVSGPDVYGDVSWTIGGAGAGAPYDGQLLVSGGAVDSLGVDACLAPTASPTTTGTTAPTTTLAPTSAPTAFEAPPFVETVLTRNDAAAGDYFGNSVAISFDYAMVGAYADNPTGDGSYSDGYGAVYVYSRSAGGLNFNDNPVAKLTAGDAESGDLFGRSVAIDGDFAVVGAPGGDDDAGSKSGSAYLFERDSDGSWTQVDKLVAGDAAVNDHFGGAVAISGDYAVVGAYGDEPTGAGTYGGGTGAAYLFKRDSGGSWTQVAKLVANDAAAYEKFGCAVAISGDYAVVGAYRDGTTGQYSYDGIGSAYVFGRDSDGSWTQAAKLVAADAAADDDHFGYAVAISGDYAVVGAYQDDDGGSDSGSAYVFGRDSDGSWTQVAKLVADDAAWGDVFGWSVAISGDYAVVGAPYDGAGYSGSIYFFRNSDGSWLQIAKLVADDAAAGDYFGMAVAIFGDYAAVGATGDDEAGAGSGSAYVYRQMDNATASPSTLPTSTPTSMPTNAPSHYLCDPGTYSEDRTGAGCTPCEPGRFTKSSGSYTCEACPINTFANSTGNVDCRSCPEGYFSGLGSASCTFCASTNLRRNAKSRRRH